MRGLQMVIMASANPLLSRVKIAWVEGATRLKHSLL